MQALRLERIYKSFGGILALGDVNMVVERGERHSVIGPNGAGKSTLFRVVGGEIKPDKGNVFLWDYEITRYPPYRRAQLGLGRTFQVSSLFPEKTVLMHVLVALLAKERTGIRFLQDVSGDLVEQAKQVLAEVGLEGKEDAEVSTLSHGEQRLVEIAMALAQKPRLLLLDEPLAGLSVFDRERLKNLLCKLPRELTVLLIEHDLEFAYSFADRVTVLHQGQVLRVGTPVDIRKDPSVVEVYVGGKGLSDRLIISREPGIRQSAALVVKDLVAGYGRGRVLNSVNLTLGEGECLAVLGRNGAGKTTLLLAIMGLIPSSGDIMFFGDHLTGGAIERARMGLALVPQGRQMIPGLSVEEELVLSQRPGRWTLDKVYSLFPRLRERRRVLSTALSGGEQQMLAIARALLRNPRVLLLDEPTEGLSPILVSHLAEILRGLNREGETILLAEQNAAFALTVAHRLCFLERGEIRECIDSRELADRADVIIRRMG